MDDRNRVSPVRDPWWLTLISCLAGLAIAVGLFLLRHEPLTRPSAAGVLMAIGATGGVVYLGTKVALGLPMRPTSAKSFTTESWLDRGWGLVLQLALVALVGVVLALI